MLLSRWHFVHMGTRLGRPRAPCARDTHKLTASTAGPTSESHRQRDRFEPTNYYQHVPVAASSADKADNSEAVIEGIAQITSSIPVRRSDLPAEEKDFILPLAIILASLNLFFFTQCQRLDLVHRW